MTSAIDRPNVVMIVLDDAGFANLGCYGSTIATPYIDALANDGLRYNQFHVTAICSPTRACLLTGRNQHAVGMGVLPEWPLDEPGYTGRIPRSAAMLPRLLRDAGCSTFAVGKWHLTPGPEQRASGPFEHWPLGIGFERYYGFLSGVTDQYQPTLVRDNSYLALWELPEEGYHLTEDLVAQTVRYLQEHQEAGGRPFFLYFAPGAVHSPHQVPREWADRYRGQFDDGWDAIRDAIFRRQRELGIVPRASDLTPRPSWIEPWSELRRQERLVYARMMEVFAGFLTHADAQIGRLLDALAALEVLDNTLVILLSDNGASAEGGPHGKLDYWTNDNRGDEAQSMLERIDEIGGPGLCNHYAWGWAWLGNTPFRLWKRYSWPGGVRVPLVVQWPAGIPSASAGGVREQFCHAIDLMPTILEAAGVELPESIDGVTQMPLHGESLLETFADPDAPSPRATQYFETLGSRAIYHDGWKAVTNHVCDFGVERELIEGSRTFEADQWSLFHVASDFSEANDLAAAHPDRLRQLVDLWWSEAGRYQVLPLVELGDLFKPETAEATSASRRYVHLAGGGPILTPSPFRGFEFVAVIDVESDASGVICAHHRYAADERFPRQGGWTCYLLNGRLTVALTVDHAEIRVIGNERVPAGTHQIGIHCRPASDEEDATDLVVKLTQDGHDAGEGRLALEQVGPLATPLTVGLLLVGRDHGFFSLSREYEPPFPFQGEIRRAVLSIPDPCPARTERDVEATLRAQ